jgi:hypothetical protein
MGINIYLMGSWVRVCFYNTQTRELVGFLNPTKPSTYCHFILEKNNKLVISLFTSSFLSNGECISS